MKNKIMKENENVKEDTDNNKVGKFIKKLREENGLSQTELGEKVYVTRQAVSQWENGRNLPDSQMYLALAEVFHVSVSDLYAGERLKTEKERSLVLVKEVGKREKKLKKTVKISIIIFLLLACAFLTYYFINSYRSLKVYTIVHWQDEFEIEGFIVLSKKDSYLKLDLYDADVKNLELYTLNNEEKNIIANSNESSIYLKERYGYNEYLNYSNADNNLQNLYLHVQLKNEKEYEIHLDHFMKYENSELVFNKEKEILEDAGNNTLSVPEKIKKEFKYEDGTYTLEKDNGNIEIYYLESVKTFGVTEKKNKITKTWEYDIKTNNLRYDEMDQNFKILNQFDINLNEKIEKDKQSIVEYFIKNYKDVYLK